MSLLGLSRNISKETSDSVAEISFAGLNVFYDTSDQCISNDDYDLIISGNVFIDNSKAKEIELDLQKAEGTFAYCLFLKKQNRVVIGTDRLGFFPLYYTEDDKVGFSFSNFLFHLKPFLTNPKPCWDAWDELLNEQDVLGDKTPIKGVKRLRQGQKLVIDNDRVCRKEFWRFESPKPVSFDEYVDKNNCLLKDGLRLMSSDRMVLPSTGGHDSRRIIITAHSLGLKFSTITQETEFKDGLDVDSYVANRVADMLRIENHQQLNMLEKKLLDLDILYKDEWNGFESANHGWAVNLLRFLPHNSQIFDGIVGDVVINNHYIASQSKYLSSDSGNSRKFVSEHVVKNRHFRIKQNFLEQTNYDRVLSELTRFDNDCNQFTLFKVFNHTRRNIGHWYSPFLLHGHKVNLPYCYGPLFEQSFSLAAAERAYAKGHLAAMSRINRDVSELPSTRTHENIKFWKGIGLKRGNFSKAPIPLNIAPIPKTIFSKFEQSFRDVILDNIVFELVPNRIFQEKPWRYEPLQRLYHFLKWLDTDHSSLPILHKQCVPELNGRKNATF